MMIYNPTIRRLEFTRNISNELPQEPAERVDGMTGASPVTTILTTRRGLPRARPCIVVTGLAHICVHLMPLMEAAGALAWKVHLFP